MKVNNEFMKLVHKTLDIHKNIVYTVYMINQHGNSEMKGIKKGSIVQDKYGDWYTVIDIYDNIITVNSGLVTKIHKNNIIKVK